MVTASSSAYKNIPAEMKDWPQWVVWRVEDREGKATKVPYSPQEPSRKAKANYHSTWDTFVTALQTAEENGFSGVGFEFSSSDPYCGVDI